MNFIDKVIKGIIAFFCYTLLTTFLMCLLPTLFPKLSTEAAIWVSLGITFVCVLLRRSFKKNKAVTKSTLKKMKEEAIEFFNKVKNNNGFIPTSSPIFLQKDEQAILTGSCKLIEARSVSYSQRTGGSVHFGGCSVGQSNGISHSEDHLKEIDGGAVVLTNKRFVFDGNKFDRTVPLNKIISINMLADSIELSVEGRNKSMFLTVPNPMIWGTCVQVLSKIDNPFEFDGSTLNVHIEAA